MFFRQPAPKPAPERSCEIRGSRESLILLVGGAGFEPATLGLLRRCSTTELTARGRNVSKEMLPRVLSTQRQLLLFSQSSCVTGRSTATTRPALSPR